MSCREIWHAPLDFASDVSTHVIFSSKHRLCNTGRSTGRYVGVFFVEPARCLARIRGVKRRGKEKTCHSQSPGEGWPEQWIWLAIARNCNCKFWSFDLSPSIEIFYGKSLNSLLVLLFIALSRLTWKGKKYDACATRTTVETIEITGVELSISSFMLELAFDEATR